MFCGKCGQQIPDSSNLCCYCGAVVTQEQKNIIKQAQSEAQPVQYPSNEPREKTDFPLKKKFLWLWVALGVAAVVSVAVILFACSKNTEKRPSVSKETVTIWILQQLYQDGTLIGETQIDENGQIVYVMEDSDGLREENFCKYEKGYLVRLDKHRNGQSIGYDIYENDEDGNRLKATTYNSSDTEKFYITYQYDHMGKCVAKIYYTGEKEYSRATYTYDTDGNLTEQVSTKGDEEVQRIICRYDENGQLLERIDFENGEQTNHYVLDYDESGNIVKRRFFDANGQEDLYYNVYQYDEKGNRIVSTAYNREIETIRIEYTYDENGNKLSQKHYESGNLTQTYTRNWVKFECSKEQAEWLYQQNKDSSNYNFPKKFVEEMK